ncbi:hypothetical protein H8S90_21130 [Olivibacter sp. SDN3]|uniref:DUF6624 domain-containing protein n=1 Tax=Olivibacter sp. SDN3 TaxID=2764720 RepID=UPI00165139CE|nr:DUF6624 domain-containing protein [Olivibacter sp. SDN3]QNL49215.1 hypothetical protein H8S90_21130 [Olivibacter sp. SDN3]
MRIILVILLMLTNFGLSVGQDSLNLDLKERLDSIYAFDQGLRRYMGNSDSLQKDSIAQLVGYTVEELDERKFEILPYHDSLNLIFVEQIIAGVGYPGKTLVGEPTNETAWLVLQHSDKIPQYFPLVKEAGQKGEIPFRLVAMMEDRLLMYEGKEQLYGTQAKGMTVTNVEKGKNEFIYFIWPVKDPANVNKRRQQAGFEDTIEENAKKMNIDYRVLTLRDVEKMAK